MVSFRFHLVSIIGVFLALGIGIAVGASVVDRATVSALERQLDSVGGRADRTNSENDRLRSDVERWEKFADEAGDELVEGRLAGVDIVVVGVQGVDREPVDRLRQSIVAAGGRVRGTVWLTGKLQLKEPGDVASLSDALVVAPGPADLVRLKVGPILVDAKGVSKLYESRVRKRDLMSFLLAAMLCFVVVFVVLVPRVYLDSLWLIVRDLWRAITH